MGQRFLGTKSSSVTGKSVVDLRRGTDTTNLWASEVQKSGKNTTTPGVSGRVNGRTEDVDLGRFKKIRSF